MTMINKNDIFEMIEEEDVKFVRLQFVDLFGELKNIAITSGQIHKALEGKVKVDAFHIEGMHDLGYDSVYLKPDLSTFAILPWRPQHGKVARLLCDLMDMQGNMIEESPRYILRKVMMDAEKRGYSFDIHPNCEFFLFLNDENGHATTHTGESAQYLDVAPLDKGENARRDLILTLEEMGFEVESSHHEMTPGQHAVDFKSAQGVRMADQILTFRTTIRTIAGRHGMHATFMPKPRTDLPGSAMRVTISIYKDGKNIMNGINGERFSKEALSCAAGMLEHQKAMAAFANPIVNSYKRLKAKFFAPSELFWSTTDYYAPVLLEVGDQDNVYMEWKMPDGASNPYLMLAQAVAVCLEAIGKEMTPPGENEKLGMLPATLMESVNAFKEDRFLRSICGESYADAYIRGKEAEWERYSREVTDWELQEYLRRI